MLLGYSQLGATDWLSVAGTEPTYKQKAGKKVLNQDISPHIWGFLQVGYQKDYGTIVDKGGINKTPFVMLPPSLDTQSGFEVNRARIAVRGMFDKHNTLNYFFMLEFGEDGITKPAGHSVGNYLTDASITYNPTQDIHLRFGQFKYPGSEEGMRAVFTSAYRNFSTASSQLLLERFLPNDAQLINGNYQAAPEQSVGAFRDRGVELFTTQQIDDDLRASIAGMIGNGTGMSSLNASGELTYYGYLAMEYLFHKGKGYYTESFKGFVWYQDGTRRLNNQNYDRVRYGLGCNYFKDGLRVGVEYIKAKGMIYNGAVDVDTDVYATNWEYKIAPGKENEADGGYINVAYFVVPKKVELMVRYDYLHRLTNLYATGGERDYKTTTLGVSYHFKGATRIDCNYAFRSLDAPNNQGAQTIVENMDNLLSIQATLKF